MENNAENKQNDLNNESPSDQSVQSSENRSDEIPHPEVGVLHDEDGKIIKVAENAVPPDAWKNQKKAYDDAWKNNKNQLMEDDI